MKNPIFNMGVICCLIILFGCTKVPKGTKQPGEEGQPKKDSTVTATSSQISGKIFSIQIFVSQSKDKAQAEAKAISQFVPDQPMDVVKVQEGGRTLWKVFVGRFPDRQNAEQLKTKLKEKYPDCWTAEREPQTESTSE